MVTTAPMSDSTTTSSPATSPRRKLSAELHALNERFGQEAVKLGEVMDVMGDRAYSLLLVLLALPFFTPVTLLGISTVFGLVIGILAFLGLVLRLNPARLPRRLRERRLPPRFFGLLLRGAERMIRFLERYSRPRLAKLVSSRIAHAAIGGGIILSAVLLSAPLMIPLSNLLPAIAIVLLANGAMEEDGAMVLAGFGAVLASLALFAAIGFFGIEIFDLVRAWFATATPAATGVIPPAP